MKCIIYKLSDGSIAIGHICAENGNLIDDLTIKRFYQEEVSVKVKVPVLNEAGEETGKFKTETKTQLHTKMRSEEEVILEEAERSKPEGCVSYRIADTSDLPGGKADGTYDKSFREAFTDNNSGSQVDVDMDKARNIHMDRIRKARNDEFIKLGFPTKLNDELEAAVISEETRTKLKKLRDIPQNTDLMKAKTPEQLKAIWPEELNLEEAS